MAVVALQYRNRWIRFLVVVAVSAVLAVASPALAKPSPGGTLTVGVDQEFRGFDPIRAGFLGVADRQVAMAVEERLFDMDAKGKLVPELGLSATPSKDGKTWTVKLRKGVLFHDGTRFDADAVVDHWRRMLDPKNRFGGLTMLQPVQGVEKVDLHAVRFLLKHPWASFPAVISGGHWIGAYIPSPKAVREDTQNRAPVGTGPFVFREWKTNDRLAVEANRSYWRKKPYLDKVVFRPIPDMQARYAAVQSGDADVILTDRGANIIQAKGEPSLAVYPGDSTGAMTFIMNTSKPPLDDLRVRRALAHAWNQELLISADYKGTLPFARDPFGKSLSCGDSGYRKHDPAQARKLLAEYGKPVTLELNHTATPRGKEAGEIMQRLFADVGVTLKLTPVTEAQLFKRVSTGDYQISGWRIMDAADMGPYLFSAFHSGSPNNFGKYGSPAIDALLEKQQTAANRKEREQALCGVAKTINEDAVQLYGGGRRLHVIARAGVGGISPVEHTVVKVQNVWTDRVRQAGK